MIGIEGPRSQYVRDYKVNAGLGLKIPHQDHIFERKIDLALHSCRYLSTDRALLSHFGVRWRCLLEASTCYGHDAEGC